MKNIYRFRLLVPLVAVVLLAAGCVGQVKAPEIGNQPAYSTADSVVKTPNILAQYQGQDGKNAMEILKATHKVSTKVFSGMGEYVDGIDGTASDSNHFFSFYVNGQQAQVGADQYITKNGEQIEWRLEEIKK